MSTQDDKNAGVYAFPVPIPSTFPNLLEAKAVQRNGKATGEAKFSLNFEGDPQVEAHAKWIAGVKAKALEVARAKWPGRDFAAESRTVDKEGLKRIPTFVFPWSNGSDLADGAKARGKDREFSRGKFVLTARSKFQPRLSAIVGGKLVDFEGDAIKANAKYFYSGVEVLAEVNFQAYDGVQPNGADGVTAYLNLVVSTNKGAKLTGGGRSASEVFSGYLGTISNVDPTGGELDDEIPF